MFLATSAYVVGPLIAFVAVAVLVAILCWTFDAGASARRSRAESVLGARPDLSSGSDPGARPDLDVPRDYGLLRTAAIMEHMAGARALKRRLSEAGIRSTFAPTAAGRVSVLVFEGQLAKARRVAGGFTTH